MIRRVQSIKSFGVFANFQWPSDLPEFKKFNLIYGWNYSGKTTLSRVFRCFEQKQLHVDFSAAQVQLKSEGGAVHHLSSPENAPVFRVFNTDFVRENLSLDSGSASPILVLGAEDIAKQELLTSKKATRDKLVLSKETNERERQQKATGIDKALTNYARDCIKNPLAEVNYNKTRFEPCVVTCKNEPGKYLLDADALKQAFTIYGSTDKKPALSLKQNPLTPISTFLSKATPLLARVVTANKPIFRLKDDAAVETWVKHGRPLHEGKDTCQFCGQQLPQAFLTTLNEHFSAEYETLMSELAELAREIASAASEKIELDAKGDFYVELASEFADARRAFDVALKKRTSVLDILAKAVGDKQAKAFRSLECPEFEDCTQAINEAIKAINKVVASHNKRTAEFEKKRQEAFRTIEMHHAATFVRAQKYNETLAEIAKLKSTIDEQAKELLKLNGEILSLEKELSESAKGAERINELLVAYFGKDDLRVEVSPDKRFQIVRRGALAKNLSEGEKTAIAFAYFITRAQDGRHPIRDTRVVIDDPISSLDANHLFNTYALIKTQLCDCRQVFISTHSFEFYSLIREWVADDEKGNDSKPQNTWRQWSVFYVKRVDNGEAVLEEIPKELLRFKSEYHFLFSTLYHFDKDPGNFNSLMSLPNVARRFMEAFGGIMIPRRTGLRGKMEKLFPDAIERERVWKFINQYSHNTSIIRSLTIPDTSECKAVVKACLKAVQDWDAEYFADLELEVA